MVDHPSPSAPAALKSSSGEDLEDGAVDHSIQDAFAVGVLQGMEFLGIQDPGEKW